MGGAQGVRLQARKLNLGRGEESQTKRRRESLVLYKSFNTLCLQLEEIEERWLNSFKIRRLPSENYTCHRACKWRDGDPCLKYIFLVGTMTAPQHIPMYWDFEQDNA
jgi:hypothetical protein